MGSDVVPGRSLLESKCKLLHVEHLINQANIYSPAVRTHVQRLRTCSS